MTAFRLNDKCAAGTGAFLEKTARYMGYTTEEIGPLVATSKTSVPISGVCAVFAHAALARGFASADASLVFTFEFSRLPFAVAIGWLVFNELTDAWTWIGALIIFCSATYITRREATLARSGLVRPRDVSDPLLLTPLRMRY